MQWMKYFKILTAKLSFTVLVGQNLKGAGAGIPSSLFEICLIEAIIKSLKCKERFSCTVGRVHNDNFLHCILTVYTVHVHVIYDLTSRYEDQFSFSRPAHLLPFFSVIA